MRIMLSSTSASASSSLIAPPHSSPTAGSHFSSSVNAPPHLVSSLTVSRCASPIADPHVDSLTALNLATLESPPSSPNRNSFSAAPSARNSSSSSLK